MVRRAERGRARPSLSRLTVTKILQFDYKFIKFLLNFPEIFVTKLLQIITELLQIVTKILQIITKMLQKCYKSVTS